jgi:hypothetical protein
MALAADLLVIAHLLFVAFVMAGGLLLLRWPGLIWLHLPAVAWGAYIEFSGAICPLTPLENQLRLAAGQATYSGGFVDRYVLPVLYPENLTATIQQGLGLLVLLVNLAIYIGLYRRRRARNRQAQGL